jgi:hypothetical protein
MVEYIYYKGQYWSWYGLKDHRGYLSLESLTEDGSGAQANPTFCHPAPPKQVEAIESFIYHKQRKQEK